LETVRDFGKYFFNSSTSTINKDLDFSKINSDSLEKEAAELLDNSNEPVQVRSLTKIEVKSAD
jgi:hypothetical protein